MGSRDVVTVRKWYAGQEFRLDKVKLADGRTMTDIQVDQLVDAMATFAPPIAGQSSLPNDYRTALAPVLAANWQ